MAGSKKKIVKQEYSPNQGKNIGRNENPDQYYSDSPSWNFKSCDRTLWSLYADESRNIFWDEILPHLQSLETQKWSDILLKAKKQNHSIDVTSLNKLAVDRLEELMIEYDSIVSLRLQGKHRIYGYITKSVFNLLWIDLNHGDNSTCVCRSRKKHT